MTKVETVNSIVKRVDAQWCVKTEQEAEKLVDDVVEGDFSVTSDWEQAVERFAEYFQSYVGAKNDEASAYRSIYG